MWQRLIAITTEVQFEDVWQGETERPIKNLQAAMSETVNDTEEMFTHQWFTAVRLGGTQNEKVMKVLMFTLCKFYRKQRWERAHTERFDR